MFPPEVWDLRLCTGDTTNYDFVYPLPQFMLQVLVKQRLKNY